jgi:DNA-binding XRE family transcriptional regulator
MIGAIMLHATLSMGGETFVLVPKREYHRLVKSGELPGFPPAGGSGNFPALATVRVSIAREVIQRREAVGLSQKALAAAAGVRVETLNRIEKCKVTADQATITKIDRALAKVEKRRPT